MAHAPKLYLTLLLAIALFWGCKAKIVSSTDPQPLAAPSGNTPSTLAVEEYQLLSAASHGDVDTINDLLDRGLDVNTRGTDGRTALMEAAYAGHAQVAKLLLQRGANYGLRKNDGETALSFAEGGKHTEIAGMINQVSRLGVASANGNVKEVRELLEKGTSVNARGEDGRTALMEACYGGHTEIVKLLLEKGTDVNARKNDGATALSFALGAKNGEIVELLRQKGAR